MALVMRSRLTDAEIARPGWYWRVEEIAPDDPRLVDFDMRKILSGGLGPCIFADWIDGSLALVPPEDLPPAVLKEAYGPARERLERLVLRTKSTTDPN